MTDFQLPPPVDRKLVAVVLNESQIELIQRAIPVDGEASHVMALLTDARLQIYARAHWDSLAAQNLAMADHLRQFVVTSATADEIRGSLCGDHFVIKNPPASLVASLQKWMLGRDVTVSGHAGASMMARMEHLTQQVYALTNRLQEEQKVRPPKADLKQFLDRAEGELSQAHSYLDGKGVPPGPLSFRIHYLAENNK